MIGLYFEHDKIAGDRKVDLSIFTSAPNQNCDNYLQKQNPSPKQSRSKSSSNRNINFTDHACSRTCLQYGSCLIHTGGPRYLGGGSPWVCGRAAPPGDRWRPSPPAGIGWALWAWFGGGGLEVGTTGETSTDSSVPERNICRNLLEDDSTVRGTMCGTFFELFLNYMRNFF